ncbi:hypothetical protein BCY86_03275 [Pajaroellobacter abortibovis]|uniref:Uncharacterized protein n=1 Tax=Pajaroellobacter abortibovis TaxID=1882918 RepID=A0A1L6MWA7_9BACT|nr:hypothetical protein BCY86_03275 [Pajaroellobacter abortibovis]
MSPVLSSEWIEGYITHLLKRFASYFAISWWTALSLPLGYVSWGSSNHEKVRKQLNLIGRRK